MSDDLLIRMLTQPDPLSELALSDWDRLLVAAREKSVLGRLLPKLQRSNHMRVPTPVMPHLESATIVANAYERMLRWEVDRIRHALAAVDTPIVLLKGAAYIMMGLPCAAGRLASDVDILVPRAQLFFVEQALQRHGWATMKSDEYDQQYYRRWMHELPPMRHHLRGTVVDVHHTILPEASRLHPDPEQLLASTRPVGNGSLRVLAPADMVLHSAVHAFHDGELSNSLRDLLDLHELSSDFGAAPDFWESLSLRARQLGLERPLFYALRYSRRYMGTPVPDAVFTALHDTRPTWLVLKTMDALMACTVAVPKPYPPLTVFAYWLLYIRSHWLRMPPLLLAHHLFYKAGKRAWHRFSTRTKANS